MGFALTLALGVIISLFSAIFVTRTMLQLIIGSEWVHNPTLFGMPVPDTRIQPRAATRLRLGERAVRS